MTRKIGRGRRRAGFAPSAPSSWSSLVDIGGESLRRRVTVLDPPSEPSRPWDAAGPPLPSTAVRSPGPALLDRLRRSPVSPTAVRRLSVVSLVCVAAIVLTGAAVRVTGSGLGCSDWPSCMKGHLTPPLQYHSLIEFGNRMVTVLLVAVIGVTFLASLLRRPFRRDLVWLSGGLVAGVVVEAVVGGIVVYSKLNPYLVVVHFLTTMLLVVVAAVLLHRAGRDYRSPGRLLVPRAALFLSRGLLLLVAVVIAAGAATTGAAPDAGGARANSSRRGSRCPCARWQNSTRPWRCSSSGSSSRWRSCSTPSTCPSASGRRRGCWSSFSSSRRLSATRSTSPTFPPRSSKSTSSVRRRS